MYRGVGADLEKQKQKISANNEQGSMKRGEKWSSEKLRKNIFRHILTRIPKNQKGRPAFRDRISRGSLESKIVYRGVGADFEKQKQKISANNEQGSMKRGEKWFSEKLRKNFDLENFRSESFSTRTSCIGSTRFRARVAKERPAFRDRITRGSLESKIVYRGVGADFEKQQKKFRLIMNRVA